MTLEATVKLPTTHDDPSTLLGGLVTFVGAVFAALTVFGVLTADQAAALGAVLTTGLPIVLAWAIRRHAWAPSTVVDAVDVAVRGVDPGDDASGRPWVHPDQLPARRQARTELDKLTTADPK